MTSRPSLPKKIEAIIEPIYCESFECYCEDHNIDYDFMINDEDGMHVMMPLHDYLRWYTDQEKGGDE